MQIELQQLIPFSLKDRLQLRSSEVWSQSLQLSQPEYIKVQAPSGSGKTTFVHLLYRMRHDYSGNILFNGRPLKEMDHQELAILRQRQVSIIFQDLRLFPNLTARENIELKRLLAPEYSGSDKIDAMAETLGISEILDQKAGICSYGEQQRIAIARALVQPFNWLIMDEPFSHLDIDNINKAKALINKECKDRGAGLIITDLDEDQYFRYDKHLLL